MTTTNRIDVNVWNANTYGSGEHSGVVVTGYPIIMGAQYPMTDTEVVLFSVDTALAPEDWDDHWYEVGTDDMPAEIKEIVDLQLAALPDRVEA